MTLLGKYSLRDELGRGGFAVVYRALDTRLNREVALKVLNASLSEDPRFVERFRLESQIAANLKHPNIVTLYEADEVDGRLYLAMDLLPGLDLRRRIERDGPLPFPLVVSVIEQIASALAYAHGYGLVHRDVKSANIILDDLGHVTLTDFGLVRAAEGSAYSSSLSLSGGFAGTVEYMAPEQVEGQTATAKSDLYALGIVAYEMVTGRVPFKADTPLAVIRMQADKVAPDPHGLRPELPDGMQLAIMKALAKMSDERQPDVTAFAQDLRVGWEAEKRQLANSTQLEAAQRQAAADQAVIKNADSVGASRPDVVSARSSGRRWPVMIATCVGLSTAAVLMFVLVIALVIFVSNLNPARNSVPTPTARISTFATASAPALPAATLTAVFASEAPTDAAATAAPTVVAPSAAPITATPTIAPTKAPLTATLEVIGVGTYVDSAQYFHVVGLVTNGTDKPVNNIELALQVTDGAGRSVLKDDSGTPTSTVLIKSTLDSLDSGESTPFDYFMSVSGADTSGWKPTVKVAKNDSPAELHRAPIDVVNPQITVHSNGQIYLTGELANKSDKPAQINNFAGAMLDASGNVAAVGYFTAITRLLAPAGDASHLDRTPFVITFDGPVKKDVKPAYYMDAVGGNPDDLTAAGTVHLKLNTSYVDAENGVHIVATISNSGTNTVTARAVAGLYDQAGQVLDADMNDPLFLLSPGGSSLAVFSSFGNLNGNGGEIKNVVSYTAQIDPFWTFGTTIDFVDLQASNITTAPNGSNVTLNGTIINTSKQSIDTPMVVVDAKDTDGRLVAANWAVATGDAPVKPGGKVTFTLTMQTPDKTDASTFKYDVSVQARVTQ